MNVWDSMNDVIIVKIIVLVIGMNRKWVMLLSSSIGMNMM